MGEHSVMDGTPTARMCDEVLDMLYDPAFDHGVPASSISTSPVSLDFEVSLATAQAISAADKAATELAESQEMGFLATPYGKAAINGFLRFPRFMGTDDHPIGIQAFNFTAKADRCYV